MYDASQNPEDEEKAKESAYAPLLSGAAPVGASSAPAATGPAPAASSPQKSAGAPGFVNFDRYMNANRSTVERDRNEKQASVESRYAALTGGLNEAKNVAAEGPKAPSAGETIVPNSVREQQVEAMGNVSATTADEARRNAGAEYKGPTQQTVDSKYAPLLTQKNELQEEANAAKTGQYTQNAFDNSLLAGAGGVDYSKVGDVEKQYGDSYGAATNAVGTAQKAHEDAKSQWAKLLETYAPQEADAVDAENTKRGEETARIEQQNRLNSAIDSLTQRKGADFAKTYRQIIALMAPEDLKAFSELSPQDPAYDIKLAQLSEKTHQAALKAWAAQQPQ